MGGDEGIYLQWENIGRGWGGGGERWRGGGGGEVCKHYKLTISYNLFIEDFKVMWDCVIIWK